MTQEEVKAYNQLIAEFMGYEYYGWNDPRHRAKPGYTSGYWGKKDALAHHLKVPKTMMFNPLGYHCYWNDLMPVVQKIRELFQDNELYDLGKNKWELIAVALETVEIKAVHITVINFIKWYNTLEENNQNG